VLPVEGTVTNTNALLGHWIPATLSATAIACWLILARRTFVAARS
jgi:hypothetical protein